MSDSNEGQNDESRREREIGEVRDAIRGIEFGEVRIMINNGVVVQIDRMERRRIPAPPK